MKIDIIDFINNFIDSFDINNLQHCQNFLFLIYNNKFILQEKQDEINTLLNDKLKEIGKNLDVNNLLNQSDSKKEKNKMDLKAVLPILFI